MLINIYFRSFRTFLKTNLLQLNLFKDGIEDEVTIKNQRRSTRLYVFLLITSLIIIGFYHSVVTYAQTIIVKSPSFIQYSTLSEKFSLECLCTKIAIKYEDFIEIKPYYHELCESDFISDDYITQLYSLYEKTWNNSVSIDFHRIAVFQFKTLRTFCQLTQETIENNLEIFLQTEFIQSQLGSQESLQIQITSLLTDFLDFTPKTFLRTLAFIQNITAQSLFMTGASITSVLPTRTISDYYTNAHFGITYKFSDNSSCTCSSSTSNNCMGLTTYKNNIIPGFHTGCYMLSALLKSTLEVFYNQTFVNILTNSSDRFQKLNSSIISNSTIEKLLSQMLVTHWTNKTFFKKYFDQCSPDYCQYTIIKHNDLLFIITSLIGVFGGLSSILKIIAPFIIITIWPIIFKLIKRQKTSTIQTRVSFVGHIKNIYQLIKQKLIELNLFKNIPPSQNENILRQERYITRIYIVLLFISIILIIIFTCITPQTNYFIKKSPSLKDFIQLYDKYPLTLNCPCNKTAIDQQFISYIKPQYHEICLSEFISSNWINIQFIQNSSIISLNTSDIRYQMKFFFQLLSTLCQMSNETIQDSLRLFYQTKFITSQTLNPQAFEIQVNLIIEHFKRIIPESFQRILNLLITNFQINQFVTPMNSYFSPSYTIDKKLSEKWLKKPGCPLESPRSVNICSCVSSSLEECYPNITINVNGTIENIPGMIQGWFPLQSLLNSTLECFYNEICLLKIKKIINSNISLTNITILKSNNQYDTINSLANNLFISSWYNENLFESYFNQCNPLTCHYTIQTRLDIIYITTRIIGMIGGINFFLYLLLPFIFKSIMKLSNYFRHLKRGNIIAIEETIHRTRRFYHHLFILFKYIKQKLIELNLFPTIPPSQDSNIIQRNRRTTRIYLILLIISILILTFYGLLKHETTTIIVESPSVSKYKELYYQYPLTLKCPCSHTAIKYNKFIYQNEPQYHQICSSIFVSSEWIKRVKIGYSAYIVQDFTRIDYRDYVSIQFQSLSQLCKLSENTLNVSLSIFEQNDFITSNIISYDEFNIRTKTILEQFVLSVSKQFMERFKLIQLINHGNQLATTFESNWKFSSKYFDNTINRAVNQPLYILAQPKIYGEENCSCGIQSNCSTLPNLIFSLDDFSLNPIIPGFHFGCLLLDSLLQSTLTCLYNKTCLGIMQANIFYSMPIKTEILTYSSLSIPNTTIETMLNNLFASEWIQKTSFDLYFNECAPQSCQYSYTMKYNLIYIVTMLFAILKPLINGLHLLIYYIELIIIKLLIIFRKKKNSVSPDAHQLKISIVDRDNNTIKEDSIPPISTIQLNSTSIKQHNKSTRKYIDRAIYICLGLVVMGVMVTIIIILRINQNKEKKFILTSTQTTLINNISSTTTEITNNCDMIFKYQSESYPTGLNPISMVTSDFNKDSFVDLAVTNFYSDTLSILLGNGDGTFQMQKIYSTGNGSHPKEIKVTDFNNDTFLDLVVTLSGTKRIMIFFGIATNDLFRLPPYDFPFYTYDNIPNAIEVADMNKDGFIDLIVGQYSNNLFYSDILKIFLNQGDGYQFYTGYLSFLAYGTIESILIDDINRDGLNDLFIIHVYGSLRKFSAYDYNNILHYNLATSYTMYGYSTMMINGKFNNDVFDDIALISPQSNVLNIIMSITGSLWSQQIYLTENYPTSIGRINFNNDLIDDLVILTCNGTLTVFLGQSIGLFNENYWSMKINTLNNDECFHSLRVTDLNQDGKDDLIFIDTQMNNIRVLLGSSCND